MLLLAVVGTAGRDKIGVVAKPLTAAHFSWMVNITQNFCAQLGVLPTLVSGGAAWADHVAVHCHRQFAYPLRLELPCAWDFTTHAFVATNVGQRANALHLQFSAALGYDTLLELEDCFGTAQVTVHAGFFARNAVVAQAPLLLAFTWGTDRPTDGGTAHTWRCHEAQHAMGRYHFSLSQF